MVCRQVAYSSTGHTPMCVSRNPTHAFNDGSTSGRPTAGQTPAVSRTPFSKESTVHYSNCGRGSQTSALANEPRAHEGALREGLLRTPVSQVRCGGDQNLPQASRQFQGECCSTVLWIAMHEWMLRSIQVRVWAETVTAKLSTPAAAAQMLVAPSWTASFQAFTLPSASRLAYPQNLIPTNPQPKQL
jgi:hypothetical protein